MYGQPQQQAPPQWQPPPRRRSNAGGVILAVLAVLLIIGWIAHAASQSAVITTCTGAGTPFAQCQQQTVPVSTTAP